MDKKTTEPESVPVTAPAQAPAPAPQPSNQGWPDQTPQPTQIQYVVAQKSLEGISGMLLFWIIIFSLTAIAYVSTFFVTITDPSLNSTGAGIATMIFSPFIIASTLFAVTLIAMRKKLAIWASIGAAGIMLLSSIISVIVTATSEQSIVSDAVDFYGDSITVIANTASSEITGAAIASIMVSLVYGGLIALYFLTSKRVKQTLVK